MTELEEAREVGRKMFNEGIKLKARIRDLEESLSDTKIFILWSENYEYHITVAKDMVEAQVIIDRDLRGYRTAVIEGRLVKSFESPDQALEGFENG